MRAISWNIIPGMSLFEKRRARQRQRQRENVLQALDQLAAAAPEARPQALAHLVDRLRPKRTRGGEGEAEQRLDWVIEQVRSDEQVRVALGETLRGLLLERQPARLLSESGILANEGLIGGFWRRMMQKLLPEDLRADQLKDQLDLLFHERNDYLWVEATPDVRWIELLDALDFSPGSAAKPGSAMPILEAMQVLSYRIAALGLEPELIRNEPSIERYESPFMTQNVELHEFITARQRAAAEKKNPDFDDKQLLVLLGQCEKILTRVRKQAAKSGASVSLTIVLVRLAQSIERLRLLLQLLEDVPAHELNVLRVRLFKALVRSENSRNSIRELWSQTVDLLSSRIVTNASKAGEQYITTGRAEFFKLFRSATGAGLVVVIAALAKIALMSEGRSPFAQALVYSTVYAAAFIVMYVCHFSLATKQPAMTANVIAKTIEGDGSKKNRLEALADLIVRTFRSQFIALVGNLVVVVPLTVYIAHMILLRDGQQYVDIEKAHHFLEDADFFSIHVWIWAATTGVCLFLTGLVSGYYDNKAAYDHIPQRVAQIRWLCRLVGKAGAQRVAGYVENHLGGLMGSIFFGVMLGSVGAVGRIFGLPIDTLHVTFTSANTAYAIVALGETLDARAILLAAAGVSVIGLMNLLVSFGLALFVAMRAQGVSFESGRGLLRELGRRLIHSPQQFFWPPRESREPPGAV
ncbi:MAG TPA: RNA methyltransferase [Stenotrophobium sp.]|nr:RNA methyltransferase [Stenotrophobium sp.]